MLCMCVVTVTSKPIVTQHWNFYSIKEHYFQYCIIYLYHSNQILHNVVVHRTWDIIFFLIFPNVFSYLWNICPWLWFTLQIFIYVIRLKSFSSLLQIVLELQNFKNGENQVCKNKFQLEMYVPC
jgi:hypothetical protein